LLPNMTDGFRLFPVDIVDFILFAIAVVGVAK
jgi:hypothetical protein